MSKTLHDSGRDFHDGDLVRYRPKGKSYWRTGVLVWETRDTFTAYWRVKSPSSDTGLGLDLVDGLRPMSDTHE
jgi:hypothetical protein